MHMTRILPQIYITHEQIRSLAKIIEDRSPMLPTTLTSVDGKLEVRSGIEVYLVDEWGNVKS